MDGKEPVGLLIDATRCGACRRCVAACMELHGFEGDPSKVTELSSKALTAILETEDWNLRNLCRHCLTPSCASVCPVGALRKSERGPVTYDFERCIGCRYCMVACPFNIPRYEWDESVPRVRKCDLCAARLEEGRIPACAEACRYGATVFGTRRELLAEAHRRIAESPGDYFDHVYGEREVGGTSVLFLAPKPLSEIGYKPILGTEPLPDLTTPVPRRVPAVVLCGGAALAAFWWITRRRDAIAAAEAAAARAAHERSRGRLAKEEPHDDR